MPRHAELQLVPHSFEDKDTHIQGKLTERKRKVKANETNLTKGT